MKRWSNRLLSLVRMGRPLFLAGGFLLHGLGALMALVEGAALDPLAFLWGQVGVTAAQLMTHYSNEYFDQAADRVNPTPTRWAGGSQVLPEGALAPRTALGAALLCGGISLAAGLRIGLALRPGPLALPLMLLGLGLALGYSAPPLRLHSRGLGELTVAVVVAGLTPLVGYYLQAGRLAPLPLLAILPLLALQFAMMLVLEMPDAVGDEVGDKRTLVVRLGIERAVRLHNRVVLAAYLLLPLAVAAGLPPLAGAGASLSAPVALWQAWRLARGAGSSPQRWNSLGFWAIGLLVGTAALEFLAFLWLWQAL